MPINLEKVSISGFLIMHEGVEFYEPSESELFNILLLLANWDFLTVFAFSTLTASSEFDRLISTEDPSVLRMAVNMSSLATSSIITSNLFGLSSCFVST